MPNLNIVATLRNLLAELYEDEASIRRVAGDAGIKTVRIALGASAINNWQALLAEAEHTNKVDALLTVVLNEYEENAKLRQLIADYHASVKQDSYSGEIKTPLYKETPWWMRRDLIIVVGILCSLFVLTLVWDHRSNFSRIWMEATVRPTAVTDSSTSTPVLPTTTIVQPSPTTSMSTNTSSLSFSIPSLVSIDQQILELEKKVTELNTVVSNLKTKLEPIAQGRQNNTTPQLTALTDDLIRNLLKNSGYIDHWEFQAVLSDSSLTAKDKQDLITMLLLQLEQDSAEQEKYVEAFRNSPSININEGPSIDIEAMKSKRILDKKLQLDKQLQMLDTLTKITDQYNRTAKGIIDDMRKKCGNTIC